jgi:hypothetical protein
MPYRGRPGVPADRLAVPQWSRLPVTAAEPNGWHNRTFRLDLVTASRSGPMETFLTGASREAFRAGLAIDAAILGARSQFGAVEGVDQSMREASKTDPATAAAAWRVIDMCLSSMPTPSDLLPHLRRARDLMDSCYADDLRCHRRCSVREGVEASLHPAFSAEYGKLPRSTLRTAASTRARTCCVPQTDSHRSVHVSGLHEPWVIQCEVPSARR